MTDPKYPKDSFPEIIEAIVPSAEKETLVNCPHCATCPVCRGTGAVAPLVAAEYIRCIDGHMLEDLQNDSEEDDDDPPAQ